jgi:hypothetical protein
MSGIIFSFKTKFTYNWIFLSEAISKLDKNPSSSLVGPMVEYTEPNSKDVSDDQMAEIKLFFKQKFAYFKVFLLLIN